MNHKTIHQTIQTSIDTALIGINAYLSQILQDADNALLKQMIQYVLQSSGKQLRARLVLLTAGVYGNITDQTRRGAALVTLVHQASLAHDDVIDKAKKRRGSLSINAHWSNQKAILIGDYLLNKAINIALQNQDYGLLNLVSQTAQTMIEGEFMQLSHTDPLAIDEMICLTIIQKKTASLMAASCAVGALSSGQATDQQVSLMYQIGEQLGMAYQIQDDLLDYGLAADLDKAIGMDIKGQKITLPLLYALQQAKDSIRKTIIKKMQLIQQEPLLLQEIIDFVHDQGGIKQAQEKMYAYRDQALTLAAENLPISPYQTALVQFLRNVVL